jgi:hypothetical protein
MTRFFFPHHFFIILIFISTDCAVWVWVYVGVGGGGGVGVGVGGCRTLRSCLFFYFFIAIMVYKDCYHVTTDCHCSLV